MTKGGDLPTSHVLEGEYLAAVNRVLRWHGIPSVGPCQVQEVLQHLTPMEMGRYCHILSEIVDALDETDEEGNPQL